MAIESLLAKKYFIEDITQSVLFIVINSNE